MGRWAIIGYNSYDAHLLQESDSGALLFTMKEEAQQWLREVEHMYKFNKWKIIELE